MIALIIAGLFGLFLAVGYMVFAVMLFVVYKIDNGKRSFRSWWKKMEL